MGMDAVEIVMLTEERFGIEINDSEAEKVNTPGRLIDLVLSKATTTGARTCRTQRGFAILRRALIQNADVRRNEVRPDVELRNLLPPEKVPAIWSFLKQSITGLQLPNLEFPPASAIILLLMILGDFTITVIVARLNAGINVAIVAGVVAAILLGLAAASFLRPFAKSIPSHIRTVGDLARLIAGALHDGRWTRGEVALGVRSIIMEVLSPSESAYHEDADFVKDLGLS